MTPLDLLDTFEGTPAKIALVATYEFDPLFFERRVLRKRGFAGAERILVLMDAGRYQELLKEGLPVSGFNRRYLVAPIIAIRTLFTRSYIFLSATVGSQESSAATIVRTLASLSTWSFVQHFRSN